MVAVERVKGDQDANMLATEYINTGISEKADEGMDIARGALSSKPSDAKYRLHKYIAVSLTLAGAVSFFIRLIGNSPELFDMLLCAACFLFGSAWLLIAVARPSRK